ncbi:MAG: hypothetical protein IKX95_06870, partial [Lachnospiraceae bacterium]|nr:hypothetical protein [Lachnospiraceae bacterium]
GQEVIKIITDEDGDETVESNIWTIGGEDEDFTYTGAAVKPVIHVYDGYNKLSEGSEYAVKYGNNVNASDNAWVQVSFGGSYKGTPAKTVYFTIKPADLAKDALCGEMIVASSNKLIAPVPSITLSSGTAVNGQLKYRYLDSEGNVVKGVKDPGTYTIEAKANKKSNNFINTLSANIIVLGKDSKPFSQVKIGFSQKQYTYTGKPVTPGYTLMLGRDKLTEGTDFTVKSIEDNTKPGNARITFAAVDGNEKGLVGTKSAEFVISNGRVLIPQGEGSDFTYTIAPSVPYAKGGAQPFITVKDGDYTLVYDKDYTVSYADNKKLSAKKQATATVKGKGNYKGSVPVTFEVVKQDIAALSANIIVDDKAESKKGYENPVVTVTDLDGNRLKAGYDFTISDYSAPENGIVTAKL